MKKRKICFVITSVIHYSRNFLLLEELKNSKNIELHIIISGLAISSKYTSLHFNIRDILKKDGHKNIHEIYINMEGDNHVTKAKSIGIGVSEFASAFNQISPDIVIVRGDRFEVLSAAIATVSMNITLAHIEGGDVTGTIDESVRHAITKLAHYHFTTNDQAKNRVIKMGENPSAVFNFGSPDIEIVKKMALNSRHFEENFVMKLGSGANFNFQEDYVMVMYHPVTSEVYNLSKNTRNLLKVIKNLDMQTLWFWPNFDAGAEKISHEIRHFKDTVKKHKVRFLRYLPPREFLTLLSKTKCLIGNSSSGIKESSYLGIPVVDIGSRQNSRLKAGNVLCCGDKKEEIEKSIRKQLKVGKYPSSNLYYSNDTSKDICKILKQCDLICQKKFVD